MRKLLLCIPMIVLLAGCGQTGASQEEQLALEIRGELLEMTGCTAQLQVTADYGQRVYQYEMTARATQEETQIQITAPETVAGCVVRTSEGGSRLEYDGLQLETGPMDPQGLTPLAVFPELLEMGRSGFITACAWEEEGALLRVDLRDPAQQEGTGRQTTLWFDVQTHALVRGEIAVDGFRAIACQVTGYTTEEEGAL